MASIPTIKQAISLCHSANITPFIWGQHGLGKSSLVAQTCAEQNIGFLDMRVSQLEASDIRGLPDRGADGRTHYLPPADMPYGDMTNEEIAAELGEKPHPDDLEGQRVYQAKLNRLRPHFQRGILFIDEVNRAQDDVLQAIFQLVLDRRVGKYVLPPGWHIVAAGNFMEGYIVSGFNDPAFLDRFCHLTLSSGETTLDDWVQYMAEVHGEHASEAIEFTTQNVAHLDGEVDARLGFNITPSRRSWDMLVRVQKAYKANPNKYDSNAYMATLSGLVGMELATAFSRYSCPVKPRDILSKGVQPFHDELEKLTRNQITGLMWGLVSYCRDKVNTDKKVADICLEFTEFMLNSQTVQDKDIIVAFVRALVSSSDKSMAAVVSNPQLAQVVANFNRKNGVATSFIDRLTEHPDLQDVLAKVAWGTAN